MDEHIEISGLEITEPGRLIEQHRNVTVDVVELVDGTISYGWRRQENTESEYYFYTEEDEDDKGTDT